MQRALLFTGQVRNAANFARYLRALEENRARFNFPIVFSTWTGELENYPDLAAQLHRLDATVITQNQPNLVLPGHILHQLVALDGGLALLPSDAFVLKTRPDLGYPGDLDRFMNMSPRPVPKDAPLRMPFEYAAHIVGGFGPHPFYVNDITYAGVASDLRQLTGLPLTFLTRYSRLAPEQLYWGGGLRADRVPVFDAFLRVYVGIIFHQQEKSLALRTALAASPLYARVIACTSLLMTDQFEFFWPDQDRDISLAQAVSFPLEALLWEDVGIRGVTRNQSAFTNNFNSAGLWQAIRAGTYANSAFGERVRDYVRAYSGPDAIAVMNAEAALLNHEATELADTIAQQVGLRDVKPIRGEEGTWRIDGPPPLWTMGQTGSDLTAKLERENNELRRLVDQLNTQLGRR